MEGQSHNSKSPPVNQADDTSVSPEVFTPFFLNIAQASSPSNTLQELCLEESLSDKKKPEKPRVCRICRRLDTGSNSHTFFKFPKKQALLRAWVEACNLFGQPVSPDWDICSSHFMNWDFVYSENGKMELDPYAIPSTCLVPVHLSSLKEGKEPLGKSMMVHKRGKVEEGEEEEEEEEKEIAPVVSYWKGNWDDFPLRCYLCEQEPLSYRERESKYSKVIFHKFPRNPEICNIWKDVCNIPECDDVSGLTICSIHFHPNDYVTPHVHPKNYPRYKKLKTGIVPSVGVPNPLTTKVAGYNDKYYLVSKTPSGNSVYRPVVDYVRIQKLATQDSPHNFEKDVKSSSKSINVIKSSIGLPSSRKTPLIALSVAPKLVSLSSTVLTPTITSVTSTKNLPTSSVFCSKDRIQSMVSCLLCPSSVQTFQNVSSPELQLLDSSNSSMTKSPTASSQSLQLSKNDSANSPCSSISSLKINDHASLSGEPSSRTDTYTSSPPTQSSSLRTTVSTNLSTTFKNLNSTHIRIVTTPKQNRSSLSCSNPSVSTSTSSSSHSLTTSSLLSSSKTKSSRTSSAPSKVSKSSILSSGHAMKSLNTKNHAIESEISKHSTSLAGESTSTLTKSVTVSLKPLDSDIKAHSPTKKFSAFLFVRPSKYRRLSSYSSHRGTKSLKSPGKSSRGDRKQLSHSKKFPVSHTRCTRVSTRCMSSKSESREPSSLTMSMESLLETVRQPFVLLHKLDFSCCKEGLVNKRSRQSCRILERKLNVFRRKQQSVIEDLPSTGKGADGLKKPRGHYNGKARKLSYCYICGTSTKDNVIFHRFPSNLMMRKVWKKACGINENNIFTNILICSNHFKPEDYYHSKDVRHKGPRRKLKSTAIPSINVPYPQDNLKISENATVVSGTTELYGETTDQFSLEIKKEPTFDGDRGDCDAQARKSNTLGYAMPGEFRKDIMLPQWKCLSKAEKIRKSVCHGICYLCGQCSGFNNDVTFHRFPYNPLMLRVWRMACDLKDQDFSHSNIRSTCLHICSHHFKPEDFSQKQSKARQLKPYSYPSVGILCDKYALNKFCEETLSRSEAMDKSASCSEEITIKEEPLLETADSTDSCDDEEEDYSAGETNNNNKRCCFLCDYKEVNCGENSSVLLHKFPVSEKINSEWKRVCNVYEHDYMDISSLFVCSNHFTTHDYVDYGFGHLVLKSTAVPSVCVPNPGHISSPAPDSPSESIDTPDDFHPADLMEVTFNEQESPVILNDDQQLPNPKAVLKVRKDLTSEKSPSALKHVEAIQEDILPSKKGFTTNRMEVKVNDTSFPKLSLVLNDVNTSANSSSPLAQRVPNAAEHSSLKEPVPPLPSSKLSVPVKYYAVSGRGRGASPSYIAIRPTSEPWKIPILKQIAKPLEGIPMTRFPGNLVALQQATKQVGNPMANTTLCMKLLKTLPANAVLSNQKLQSGQQLNNESGGEKIQQFNNKGIPAIPANAVLSNQRLQSVQQMNNKGGKEKIPQSNNKGLDTYPAPLVPNFVSNSAISTPCTAQLSETNSQAQTKETTLDAGKEKENDDLSHVAKRPRFSSDEETNNSPKSKRKKDTSSGLDNSIVFSAPTIKFYSIKDILNHLHSVNMLSQEAVDTIMTTLPEVTQELIASKLLGKTRGTASMQLRSFSLTLHFFSLKAFNYVKVFWPYLIHSHDLISIWFTGYGGKPGFTQEVFDDIYEKTRNNDSPFLCNLCIGEMPIRREVLFEDDQFYGTINFGTELDLKADNLPEAQTVLVFFVSALHKSWRFPVGYFFINSLNSNERANVLTKCLNLLNKVRAKVVSLTIDGSPINVSMCSNLGAKFVDGDDRQPWFLNPITQEKILVFWDAYRMLRLVRDCLADAEYLTKQDGKTIFWSTLRLFVKLQSKEYMGCYTELSHQHLDPHNRNDMLLCRQTFSQNLCKALRSVHIKVCQNFQLISKYCSVFCHVLNMLSSENIFSTRECGSAITAQSREFLLRSAKSFENYIMSLKDIGGTPVTKSSRKTGFLGLIMDLENIFELFDYLKENGLKQLLTAKLSHEYVENFFAAIRKESTMNLPNAKQFQDAYGKLVISHNTTVAGASNYLVDSIEMIQMMSLKKYFKYPVRNFSVSICVKSLDDAFFRAVTCICPLVNVKKCVGGFVAKKILCKGLCSVCARHLTKEPCVEKLMKEYGVQALIEPTQDVCKICDVGETVFRENRLLILHCKYNKKDFVNEVFSRVCWDVFCSESMQEHILEQGYLDNHRTQICKLVIETFYSIKYFHETQLLEEDNFVS